MFLVGEERSGGILDLIFVLLFQLHLHFSLVEFFQLSFPVQSLEEIDLLIQKNTPNDLKVSFHF